MARYFMCRQPYFHKLQASAVSKICAEIKMSCMISLCLIDSLKT